MRADDTSYSEYLPKKISPAAHLDYLTERIFTCGCGVSVTTRSRNKKRCADCQALADQRTQERNNAKRKKRDQAARLSLSPRPARSPQHSTVPGTKQ